GNNAPIDNGIYHAGDTVTVLPNIPTRTGYTFTGWLYNTAMYRGGDTFTMPTTENAVLVAQWTANTYTVTYAPGTQGTFTPQTHSNLPYGTNTPTFNGTPTGNTGYTFTGWTPTITNTVTSDITYVAQWTPTSSSGGNGSGSGGSGSSNKSSPPTSPPTETEPPTSPPPTETPPNKEEETKLSWALVNLTLSATGIILALLMITRTTLITTKKHPTKIQTQPTKNQQPPTKQKKTQTLWLLATVTLSIAGVIVFLLTENMSLPMKLVDKWTIINTIIFVAEIITITLSFKHEKKTTKNTTPNNTPTPNNP
ncbi:MAG: InlB B-repeat-containing protein, partial [Candidatus Bathyarchaeota archaeon]|nr:InlB B-repeat-containing protein [Candidatus Termiticorpusculum sp.]